MGDGSWRIALHEPWLIGNAERYLLECLATNYVSSVGPFVTRFEEEFALFVEVRHAVAVCNGTAAIHTALRVLGVGPGDEVLVSTFTFVASVNPNRYQGASPILIDSEIRIWNIDPALVVAALEARAAIGRLPKAILVVHLYGHPADMDSILEIADRYKVAVVEDAAEAHGAKYKGRPVGGLGDLGCFSFYGNNITTGEGGMVVTNRQDLTDKLRMLRDHGMFRELLIQSLAEKGIETRPFFRPVHTQPCHATGLHLPVAEKISNMGVSLPSGADLTTEQTQRVADEVTGLLRGRKSDIGEN